MQKMFLLIIAFSIAACNTNHQSKIGQTQMVNKEIKQSDLNNDQIKTYDFLKGMYQDSYFPSFLVDKVKIILLNLCYQIEVQKPQSLEELYSLSHSATNKINDLEDEFFENNSEIETAAREIMAMDFEFIAISYGYEADVEELIATRNW